ncbi:hypothetical protein RRG08_005831 [Elysia crispata]|uniref:Uncharacterized protein n=1 Tax=Elysia crispata TaxID=231223 RepID=A0AAE1CWR4_9GAST|nr:hypothetical protein RRG08_005831 [Elysia crispata]
MAGQIQNRTGSANLKGSCTEELSLHSSSHHIINANNSKRKLAEKWLRFDSPGIVCYENVRVGRSRQRHRDRASGRKEELMRTLSFHKF